MPADRVKTFFESYHGLAAQNGSTRAANCASCHGVHKILPSSDPASTINTAHLVETCGKCHPGASENFAQGKIHVHVDAASADGGSNLGEVVNWWVRRIYLVMIFSVVGLMAVHNALIFGRKAAAARAREPKRNLQRMDASQRAQHFILLVSFIILAWSGFALKFPDSWVAHSLGSDERLRRWIHRIAGVILLLAGLYHLGYAAGAKEGRRLIKDLAPRPKDLRDLMANALFLTGLSKVKPKFGRFGYAEKMEYWAVVWGTMIMGVTGLAIWCKIEVTHWLPRWTSKWPPPFTITKRFWPVWPSSCGIFTMSFLIRTSIRSTAPASMAVSRGNGWKKNIPSTRPITTMANWRRLRKPHRNEAAKTTAQRFVRRLHGVTASVCKY